MAGATFYNKRLLGHVDDTDFTEYQGIGSDPLYKRFKSVESVVKNNIDPKYQSFLSCPFYEDGYIYWYVDEWKEIPRCFTELTGSERKYYNDIKEETIQHYKCVLSKLVSEEYVILSGALKFIDDNFLYCYDDKVVLIAWGMRPENSKHIVGGKWFKTTARLDKKTITFDVGTHGKLDTNIEGVPYLSVVKREKGHVLTSRDIPVIAANEGYEFVCWTPNPLGCEVTEDLVFKAKYQKKESIEVKPVDKKIHVEFISGNDGRLNGNSRLEVLSGHNLSPDEIPAIIPNQGFKFVKWNPSINEQILSDTIFIAEYSQVFSKCTFLPGEHGSIQGRADIIKPYGSSLLVSEIPSVESHKGYEFTGWDVDPQTELKGDRVFVAQYEKVLPWYKRCWLWMTEFFEGRGCLKWLLWILLFILLFWFLSWLLRDCHGMEVDRYGNHVLPVDRVDKIEQIKGPDGNLRDNNGSIGSIIKDDGSLPKHGVISPIVGDDGQLPPVVSNPGAPDVIGNRLNIYFENNEADLDKWAKDFKKIYSSDEYQIIGSDPHVRMIQIKVPAGQRNTIREELPNKITDQKFFVVDESIMTLQGYKNTGSSKDTKGWHLEATHLKDAWNISKGKSDVVIAVVDDGIDVDHRMFKNRLYKAYNVFTQNRNLSVGNGHGTHVAALAAGSSDFYELGAAGVAPNCKIMPIQVFDNGMCTFSSLASGIMYAIHNGADVVNVSIGPSFKGLDKLPVDEQIKVANQLFKNEERVYEHIIKTAKEKNVVLVFAAGNDNIVTAILPECRSASTTINVAACTPQYKSSDFTNYLLGTNVSAPGVSIYSAYPSDSFKSLDGTSMAAPIISGTVALMKGIKKDITGKQAIAVIQSTGRELDKYIPPMVLIDKALQAVKDGNIPSEPIWTHRIEQGGIEQGEIEQGEIEQGEIEHIGSNPEGGERNKDVEKEESTGDDYSSLRNILKQLKEKRELLDKKINEIERKLK